MEADTYGDVVASVYGSGLSQGNPMHAYRGCFDIDGYLDGWEVPTRKMESLQTIGGCISACARDHLAAAALGNSEVCLCRKAVDGEKVQEANCNNPCSGNKKVPLRP